MPDGGVCIRNPANFSEAIALLGSRREAAEWIGCQRQGAKTMYLRDWVPQRYWPGLIRGLAHYGFNLTQDELMAWAKAREKWVRPAPPPQDWSNLPQMEIAIARQVGAKVKDYELAREAAGFAILQMMEYAQPHLGYGVRCAFNYVKQKWNERVRGVVYLEDEELRQAANLTLVTQPNQLPSLELREVMAAAAQLPERYRQCFEAMCAGADNEEIADLMGVERQSASTYTGHTRDLLRRFLDEREAATLPVEPDPDAPQPIEPRTPWRPIDEEDVLAIRRSLDTGAALARHFGVGPAAISKIRKRRTWAHVE